MVPRRRETQWSPGIVRICQVSIKASNAPTMGVHRPGMRRSPHPARTADVIVVVTGGSLHSIAPARTTSAEPATRRMRSKPVPGQPPANVEYRRRNTHPSRSLLVCDIREANRNPKKSCNRHSLESVDLRRARQGGGELQLDDSSLQSDHRGVGSIVGAQFRKDVLDSTLDGFLGDRELIRNLLVRIAGRDQSQHGDFRRRQGIIGRMLGDFVRGLWRKASSFRHGPHGWSPAVPCAKYSSAGKPEPQP